MEQLPTSEFQKYAHNIVDTIGEGLLILDEDLRVVSVNKAFCETFLVTPSETTGRLLYDVGNKQWDIPKLRHLLEKIVPRQEMVERFEVRHQFEKIGEKVMQLNARRLVRQEGKAGLILLAIEDITQQHELQQRVRASEERYRLLVEKINSIIIGIDTEGYITFFNSFSEKVFGYSRDEAIGKPFVGNIVPVNDSSGIDNSRLIDEILTNPEKFYAAESEGISKDGRNVTFSWSAIVTREPSKGSIEILVDGNDITETKQAKDSLRLSEEKYRAFVRAGSQVIFRMNPDWSEMRELSGRHLLADTEDPDPDWPRKYILEEDSAYVWSAISEAVRTKGTFELEHRVIKADGTVGWAFSRAIPLLDANGDIYEWFGAASDITDRKHLEDARLRNAELAAANRELESFSYSVSHDLRHPLRAIKGFSNILLEEYSDKVDEDGKDILNRIMSSTDKMASIIDDMLNLAGISLESMNYRKIDLSSIANTVVNDLRRTDPERDVEVTIALEMPAFADPRLMSIALTNLIGNAWKYSGRNPKARIDFGIMSTANENVFYIRDNGAGFDMNLSHKLFRPFHRLHSGCQFSGTGIGLAIVQKIIQRHGGRIWAESEIGKGATFYFTLASPAGGENNAE